MSVTGMPVKAMLVALIACEIPNPKIQIPNKSQIPIAEAASSFLIVPRDDRGKNQHELARFGCKILGLRLRCRIRFYQPQKQSAFLRFLSANLGAQKKVLFAQG